MKKLLCLALALTMCLGLALPAFAAEAETFAVNPANAYWRNGEYVVDGVTYEDYGRITNDNNGFIKDDQENFEVYKNMLLHYFPSEDANLLEMWLRLGVWVYITHKYSSAPSLPLMKACYDKDGPMNLMTRDEWETYWWDEHAFDVYTSGVRFANSLKDANEQMSSHATWVYRRQSSDEDVRWGLSDLRNDPRYTDSQPVFWLMIRGSKSSGSARASRGHGPGLAVVFSDFKFQPVLPNQKDSGTQYHHTAVGSPVETPNVVRTESVNDTLQTVSHSQSVSESITTSMSTSFSRSSEFSWSTGVSVGSEWGVSAGPVNVSQNLEIQTTVAQAITQAWSQEKGSSFTESKESTVAVEMPPHTRVMLESTKAQQEYRTSWNGPMELVFKVTFLDYGLGLDSGEPCMARVITSFPKGDISGEPQNARESLKYRYEHRDYFRDLNWDAMQRHSEGFHYPTGSSDCTLSRAFNILAPRAPSLYRMENLRTVHTLTYHKAENLMALYPLVQITTTGLEEIHLNPGETMYPSEIGLRGIDSRNGPFFGFDKAHGSWILVDENQNPLPKDSPIARLTVNPVSGTTKLVAGSQRGTVYLKYLIDEDYYAKIYTDSAITNGPGLATCLIPVNVINSYYRVGMDAMSHGSVSSSHTSATAGTRVTLTARPSPNYRLEKLEVLDDRNEAVTTVRSGNEFTFVMPDSDVTVRAEFRLDSSVFVDVPPNAWFFEHVNWAYQNGITSGVTATTFEPGSTCTRAEAVSFLWRAQGCPAPAPTGNPFTDVREDSWYYEAVLWASQNGITVGITPTTFEPRTTCTRAEVVSFLWRAAGQPAPGAGRNPFHDVSGSSWYCQAVLWAYARGITAGIDDNTFAPTQTCTRAQIVTLLHKAM